jgi:hypothetical protein
LARLSWEELVQRAIALQGAGAVSNNPPTFSDEELAAELEPFDPTPEEKEFLIQARRKELALVDRYFGDGPTNANVLSWVEISDLNRRIESYLGSNRFKVYQRIQTPGCAMLMTSAVPHGMSTDTVDRYVRLYWDTYAKWSLASEASRLQICRDAEEELTKLVGLWAPHVSCDWPFRFASVVCPRLLPGDEELAAELAPSAGELEWLGRARRLEDEILEYYADPGRWEEDRLWVTMKETLGPERYRILQETRTPGYRELYVALRKRNLPTRDVVDKYVALYGETMPRSLNPLFGYRAKHEGAQKLIALVGKEIYEEIRVATHVFDPTIPPDRPLPPLSPREQRLEELILGKGRSRSNAPSLDSPSPARP